MKKILLATTLLVGTAGFASAESTLSGEAGAWLAYNGTDTSFNHKVRPKFSFSGATDSGLEFGASLTLKEDGNTDGPGSVFVKGAFGTISFGDVDSADAAVGVGMGDIGFDGLGVDNVAETGRNTSGSDVLYVYSNAGITAALSVEDPTTGDDYALGVAYANDAFSAAVGYSDTNGDKTTNITLGATVSGVKASIYAQSGDVVADTYGLTAAYTMDALTVSAAYAINDTAGTTAVGVDAAYNLGGGASIKGGIASIDGADAVADLGVSFAF